MRSWMFNRLSGHALGIAQLLDALASALPDCGASLAPAEALAPAEEQALAVSQGEEDAGWPSLSAIIAELRVGMMFEVQEAGRCYPVSVCLGSLASDCRSTAEEFSSLCGPDLPAGQPEIAPSAVLRLRQIAGIPARDACAVALRVVRFQLDDAVDACQTYSSLALVPADILSAIEIARADFQAVRSRLDSLAAHFPCRSAQDASPSPA